MNNTQRLDAFLETGVGTIYSAVSAHVLRDAVPIFTAAFGTGDPDGRLDQPPAVTPDTFFDLASLSKLFTTTALFRLIDAGRVTLDTPLAAVLPEFSGMRPIRPYPNPLNTGEWVEVVPPTDVQIDTSTITLRQLLSHSSGLPAWLNLRTLPDNTARLHACFTTPFAYPPGTQVVYSDIGFILLGEVVKRLSATDSLATAMRELVLQPLGLSVHYRRAPADLSDQIALAPTEFCQWRQRRIVGEVHDENAASFGGVSGHAGLFGTARDVAALGQVYLDKGTGFISPELVREATQVQIADRGLGWMLRTAELSSSGQYFSPGSYGHTGFTGTSLWIDPKRRIVCALLTNAVFYGRDKMAILKFRRNFHDRLIETLES
jgi:CubicO group peptidase (beta-lactamase class C family)